MKINRLISLIAILGMLLGSGAPAALADSDAPTASGRPGLQLVPNPGPVSGPLATDGEAATGGTSRFAPAAPPGPRPGLAPTGTVRLSVSLDLAPLGAVGKNMTPAERVAYAAQIAALQDQVAADIAAQGGTVVARFRNVSTGLVVRAPAAQADALAKLAHVTGVRAIGDYELDLSET